jgi:hypothetical protein
LLGRVFGKPFYSAASSTDVSRPAANQEPATEEASFVTSPTIETNPQFFFGSGDGSNGHYAERQNRRIAPSTEARGVVPMWYGYAIEAIYIMIGTVLTVSVLGILIYH